MKVQAWWLFGLVLAACSDDAPSEVQQDAGQDVAVDTTSDVGADTEDDVGPVALTTFAFDPTGTGFFDVPFPSDVRKKADGTFGYRDFQSLYDIGVSKLWLDASDDLKTGFGLTSAMYLHFNAALDVTTIPSTFDESMEEGASVFLIDVDAGSAKKGERLPIRCRFTQAAGTHHPANQLACGSPYGVLREPETTYALVVTRGVKGADGVPVSTPLALSSLLGGADVDGANGVVSSAAYVSAKDAIVAAGTPAEDIAGFSLFTTFDPTARLRQIYEFYAALPEPSLDSGKPIEEVAVYDDYVVLKAYYDVPNIQEGSLPYGQPPAGRIVFGADGKPVVQRQESVQVNITIPRKPMPAEGYPIMIYAHGSGGQAVELMDRGPKTMSGDMPPAGSGPASNLAQYGVAGLSVDFAIHDTRFPESPDTTGLKLYNLLGNPRAMIDNFVIASNEVGLHSRLIANLAIDVSSVPSLDPTWVPGGVISFNRDAIAVMGQSMGSMISTPSVTLPNEIDALINSGSGGTLLEIALASKDPLEIKPVLRRLLKLRADEEFDELDISLNTLQHVFDWIDPTLHARHVIQRPHLGAAARHVFHPSGLEDRYFSPRARAGLSLALGVPMAEPVLEPLAFDWMRWAGYESAIPLPISANMAQGVTGFVRQYEPAYFEAGHYVMFDKPEARAQYSCFVKSLAQGAPVLRSPEDSTPENCP